MHCLGIQKQLLEKTGAGSVGGWAPGLAMAPTVPTVPAVGASYAPEATRAPPPCWASRIFFLGFLASGLVLGSALGGSPPLLG